MSPKELEKTVYGSWFKGVTKNHVGKQQNFLLCGMDTETCYGQIFAMGFYDGLTYRQCYGLKRNYLFDFLDLVFDLPFNNSTVVVACHNLAFDLGVLFWPYLWKNKKVKGRSKKELDFYVKERDCQIKAFMGTPCFGSIKKGKRTIHLIDTYGFFQTSLKKALEMNGGEVQKMEKPKLLGKRVIPEEEMTPYLKADTMGVTTLLKEVIKLHEEYDTRLCVSLPQLASRIFRHHYLKKDFVQQPAGLHSAAMLSYHGGKNTFVGGAGWHEAVWDLDIKSAYPEAMTKLPNFEEGEWIRIRSITEALKYEHGIYQVNGSANDCRWGCLFDHDFKRIRGEFKETWITSYELSEFIRTREGHISNVWGYAYKAHGGISAFKRFVRDFFRLKESARNPVKRHFYKLILNSLYGKFIQRTEKEDGKKEVGSLFDPAVASLITGRVRAVIHRLEHKYESLHTATDGFLTKIKPDPKDLGEGLGKLKQENFGRCLIIRNKLYVHYDKDGKIFKRGLHGFQGTAEELINLWNKKKSEYSVERLQKWASAWHSGIPPGFPLTKKLKLHHPELNGDS